MTYKINNIELTEEQVKEVAENYIKNNYQYKQEHKRKYFQPSLRDLEGLEIIRK